jgi:lipopolysaccharide/colanic/teichoic acid biosynthesis glycosyltransferase
MMKRSVDVLASLAGLVVLAPVFAVVALAIKLDSRGPVFFRQERIGRHFKPFRILKFRSMVSDAPSRGSAITFVTGDARITRVGKVLRRTKLDEFPQLINVLLGDMSLVGPRPEIPEYVERFRDDYRQVLEVRPGITDLASVKYRDEAALLEQFEHPAEAYLETILPDKIRLGREYVERSSFLLDMSLVFRTVFAIPARVAAVDRSGRAGVAAGDVTPPGSRADVSEGLADGRAFRDLR